MKKFKFPTDMRFFQVALSDLPEHEQKSLKKSEFFAEAFEVASDKELIDSVRTYYDKSDKSPLMEYQYKYFQWCYQLSREANYIVRFVCPVNGNTDAEEICYQFYVAIDKSNGMQYFLVNFNNFWESCVSLFEEDFVRNFVHRRCPDTLRMYKFGKAALAHRKAIVKDAFFLSPGMSMLVIPSGLDDPALSFWGKCDSKALEELYDKKIQTPLKSLYDEILGVLAQLRRWDFIYADKASQSFCSVKMLPVIVGQETLPKDKREALLKRGFVETAYSFDSQQQEQNIPADFHEIQETIQIMDNFDFHDEEVAATVAYDICWPDGMHSWSCKIPICFSDLLTRFDTYELESKLPSLSKAYYNGMMNRFKEGGLIENNYKEMIYLYDYDQYNKGKANKIHIDRSASLKKVILEIIKFNQYVGLKNAKENNKDSEKFKDTLKRGLLYQLLGTFLGG